ncbi:MAG: HAD-IC family P-type ATPase [Anaerolineae bacterium]
MASLQGLSESEVAARRARGQGNEVRLPTSRSYGDILRQNILNLINVVLFTIGAVMVAIGRVGDAVTSVGLIFLNVIIGIFQEVRAKRQLDRIALLTRPKVTVRREGQEKAIDPAEIVLGDILVARPGDQIVVDGVVVGDGEMEVDESLLTGESDQVQKRAGDEVFSGSFCVTGAALYEARRVGEASFANQLTTSARSFRVVKTPLQQDVELVIRLLMLVAMLLGFLMFISAVVSPIPLVRGVQMAAVIAGLVPNGLFFMVIVAYALGALRIATRGVLIQQSNSVESLSNVNVLCMDKTGTLTANRINYDDARPIGIDKAALERLLGDFARSASVTNRTGEAIIAALGGQARPAVDEVTFSSARKWSALAFDDGDLRGVYALGALEMLEPYLQPGVDLSAQVDEWSDAGLRVLLFAHRPDAATLHDAQGAPQLPHGLAPLGLLCFSDELRPEAKATLEGFARAGVRLKVISGDNPHTVAALAKQAGLPGDLRAVSGTELAAMDAATFTQTAEEATIFGRITPQQKEKLVETLRGRGCYVAMIGDGVNDVLSLKKAQLGIAMQSGSAATRGVADMVLLNDSFAALPPAFLEGQRIINGMKDILRLFLTRAVFAALLILSVAVVGIGFPYVPKHVSLLTFLAVGVPTFALALWARPAPPKRRILYTVTHFVFPAAISIFVFGLLLYTFYFSVAYNEVIQVNVTPAEIAAFESYAGIDYAIDSQDAYAFEVASVTARTVLTTFTIITGIVLVVFVEPPTPFFVGGDALSPDKRPTILAGCLLLAFVAIMLIEPVRDFFELILLSPADYAIIGVVTVIWALVLRYLWRARLLERFLHLEAS